MLQKDSRVYTLMGTTPVLGSSPASKEIRTQFVASKAPTQELREEEIETDQYDVNEKGVTVFNRNDKDELCMMSHQIKGFLKGALGALRSQLEVAAYKGKIDTLTSIEPRYIPIKRDGKVLREEDEMLERPIRTDGPKGPRTALQSSEMLHPNWEVTFELTLFPNSGTAKSKPLDWDAIETALDYGAYHGLGQWRGADYGRFIWKREED